MKRLFAILAAAACCAVFAQGEYTVITNPAETASTAARINWHTDPGSGSRTCFYTELTDTAWQHARKATASRELVTAFDSLMSKLPNGEDCFERVRFDRNTVELQGLTPATGRPLDGCRHLRFPLLYAAAQAPRGCHGHARHP